MCNSFSLPGIKCIAHINANTLPSDITLQAIAGVPVGVFQDMSHLHTTGEPTCVCTRNNAHNGSSQTVELTFQTTEDLPQDYPLAFLLIDAMDQAYLVGVREAPHPAIEATTDKGTPSGESNTTTYKVNYTAPRALIPCMVG